MFLMRREMYYNVYECGRREICAEVVINICENSKIVVRIDQLYR